MLPFLTRKYLCIFLNLNITFYCVMFSHTDDEDCAMIKQMVNDNIKAGHDENNETIV